MKKLFPFVCLLITAITIYAQQTDFPKLTGPYLGQKPPGMTPELFGPGIVSKEGIQGKLFITPDGKYLFFTRSDDIFRVSAKIIEELRPNE